MEGFLRYQIEAMRYIDLLMLLISSGKINFAMIAYIEICIRLAESHLFQRGSFY